MFAGWKNRQAGTSRSRIACWRRARRSARSAAMSMSDVFGTRRLDTGCTCGRSLTTRDSTRPAQQRGQTPLLHARCKNGSDPVFPSARVAAQRLAHAVHAAAGQLELAHVRVVDLEARAPAACAFSSGAAVEDSTRSLPSATTLQPSAHRLAEADRHDLDPLRLDPARRCPDRSCRGRRPRASRPACTPSGRCARSTRRSARSCTSMPSASIQPPTWRAATSSPRSPV